MGDIHWFNSYTHDTQFTVEFDDSDVSSEFSELVYGLIENADGMAYRRDETIASQRASINQLRDDVLETSRALADTIQELADYKAEYVPPENRRNGVSIADYLDNEHNDMGDKTYAKTNL